MTPDEIKIECEKIHAEIAASENRLKDIRKDCKHEKTERGLYSYRIGATFPADICVYCGTPVKNHF